MKGYLSFYWAVERQPYSVSYSFRDKIPERRWAFAIEPSLLPPGAPEFTISIHSLSRFSRGLRDWREMNRFDLAMSRETFRE
jgi:hypothetical protein